MKEVFQNVTSVNWVNIPTRELDALLQSVVFNNIHWVESGRQGLVTHFGIGEDPRPAMIVFQGGCPKHARMAEDGTVLWEEGLDDRWYNRHLPHYTTDSSAAVLLLEKLMSEGFNVSGEFGFHSEGRFEYVFHITKNYGIEHVAEARAFSHAEAIGKLALKARGVVVND